MAIAFKMISMYKKGRMSKADCTYYDDDGKTVAKKTVFVKYKNGWITKYSEKYSDSKYADWDKYTYKFYPNKKPKTVTMRFPEGTEKYCFNKKGLIDKIDADKIEYKYDKAGRPVEAVRYMHYSDGSDRPEYRYTFTCKGTKTKNVKTYIGVMSQIIGVRCMFAVDAVPCPGFL